MKGRESEQTAQTVQWEAPAGLRATSIRRCGIWDTKTNVRIAAEESNNSAVPFNNLGRSFGRFFTVNSPVMT